MRSPTSSNFSIWQNQNHQHKQKLMCRRTTKCTLHLRLMKLLSRSSWANPTAKSKSSTSRSKSLGQLSKATSTSPQQWHASSSLATLKIFWSVELILERVAICGTRPLSKWLARLKLMPASSTCSWIHLIRFCLLVNRSYSW